MMSLVYGSVCSGIEAATVAWHGLGWKPAFFSEIDTAPREALQYHYPRVPLHGDFTTIGKDEYGPIDLLVGGTPCQSFSIAGLRGGMDDERGNLALEFVRLAQRKSATWVDWENVPGVFSSNSGEDFRCFLSGLAGWDITIPAGGWKNSGVVTPAPGHYGLAWRVLDAQYFGVPQRRRRVFVIGYLGDWRPAAAVLFERQSLQGHPAPSRKPGEEVAGTLSSRTKGGGVHGTDFELAGGLQVAQAFGGNNTSGPIDVATAVKGDNSNYDFESETFIASIHGTQDPLVNAGKAHPLGRNNGQENAICIQTAKPPAVCFAQNTRDELREMDVVGALSAHPGMKQTSYIRENIIVRRLTPIECERLQGFPDNYTNIDYYACCRGTFPRALGKHGCPTCKGDKVAQLKTMPVGSRYKVLGNSMAVPVMRWVGERIQMVEKLKRGHEQ